MDQSNPKIPPQPVNPPEAAIDQPTEAGYTPEPPLSPRAWFAQNGPFLVLFVGLLAYWYVTYGVGFLIMVAKAALGLGFVVFIHELGHFLAAKWCDVHVLTFSIGFGPAIPGCSFTHGETTYKLAVLPLGGYVNMVGEGPDADEEEDYPRSFKNKTVGQRMLIISAGVIMNVLFGAFCFVAIYMTTGEERAPGILARTEPGSRAWEAGVQPGWKIADIDGTKDPYFDQMRVAVALSDAGRDIHFTFVDRHGETHTRTMEPIRDENGIVPIIGVGSPLKMELSPARYRERMLGSAVRISSPAAHARALPLERGDLPLEATDPSKDNAVTPLTSPQGPWMELCSRLMQSKTQPFQLIVRRGEKNQTLDVPVGGFDFEDFIVSTTDPKTPEQPYNLLDLPLDPTRPSTDGLTDPFEFRERMTRLAGKPVVLGVRRGGTDGEVIKILVPPAYYRDFGMRMKMGKVASVRRDSPASVAKVQKADTITGVKLHYEKETIVLSEKQRDPIRLPFELARIIEGDSKRNPEKWQVELTVQRLVDRNQLSTEQLKLTGWQSQFNLSGEQPGNASSPMSIPQLGIAYWVESTVNHVEKGSPADKAGILVGDVIEKIRVKERGNKPGETKWSNRVEMASTRGKQKVHDQWATWFFRIQDLDHPEVQFSIRRVDGETKTAVEVQVPAGSESLIPLPDETWPQEDRGLALMMDTRRHKAETLVQSLAFGLMRTKDFILQMYANLKSLLTGRISTKSLGGPIEIATQAYNFAGEDLAMFGLFLAMISINLAVVNFLPIPILDGGHMMFLIYEKIRGQKPSEAVQVVATYIGLAAILGLMCFVFYLDMQRRGWL